ncbi:MAG: NTP transferase domain-containing protein [Candidatus Hodarchaeales archaeon]|jgi:2-phospho-L-lactate guanylyltransferase
MISSGCVIPIRGINSGKQRLRKSLPSFKNTQISSLISLILGRTFNLCTDYFEPVWIMTKNPTGVLNQLQKKPARIIQDPSEDLNESLSLVAREMAFNTESMAVITPDLPILQSDDIKNLLSCFNGHNCVIAPSKDVGTSGLIVPLDKVSQLSNFGFQFGPKSFSKHLQAFSRARLTYQVIHSRGFQWDLDNIDDIQEIFQEQKHLLPECVEEKMLPLISPNSGL